MLTDVRFMSLQGPEDYHITVIVVLPEDLIRLRTIAIDHNFPSRLKGGDRHLISTLESLACRRKMERGTKTGGMSER